MDGIEITGSPIQRELIFDEHSVAAWLMGRQAGKSFAARQRIMLKLCTIPSYKFMYIVPWYSQGAVNIYLELVSGPLRDYIVKAKVQPFCQFWLSNGSYFQLRCWNKNPTAIKSQTCDEIFCDEIQNFTHTDQFWSILSPLLGISAALGRSGKLTIAGQHRGVNSWYYRDIFLPGYKTNSSTHRSWQVPSRDGLFFQTEAGKAYLARQKSLMTPVDFQQEYECEPTANRNATFRPSDLATITRGVVPEFREQGHTYVMGLDIGGQKDLCAVSVVDAVSGLTVHSEAFALGTPYPVAAKLADDVARKWDVSVCIIDATGGGAPGQAADDTILNYFRTAIGKPIELLYWGGRVQQRIVRNTILMMDEATLKFQRGDTSPFQLSIPASLRGLLDELSSYEFHATRGGTYYQAQEGCHDDLAASWIMALWGIAEKWHYKGPSKEDLRRFMNGDEESNWIQTRRKEAFERIEKMAGAAPVSVR
ncbi:MAG TPA: hypothetical protein VGP72_32090 [Planctomycetota bacterium]|jgi:hypothetical protein